MADQSNPRIPSLDGFRAISILMVLASHIVYTKGFFTDAIPNTAFERLGPLGVRVFFVISGFLITSILLKELANHQKIDLVRFYFRRSLRIFLPFYFFVLVIASLQTTGLVNLPLRDYFHAVTYTMNYYPERSWDLGHTWSLSVEEQFYLLWPAILLFTGKGRAKRIVLAFFVTAPIFRMVYYFTRPELVLYELGYRFETAADAIAIGCLLAMFSDWLNRQRIYQVILSSRLLILAPLLVLVAAEIDPTHKKYLIAAIPFQNVGIALCLAWGVKHSQGIIGRFLNSKLMVWIGLISYSLYLWQQVFMNPRSLWWSAQFPVNLVFCFLAASLSYYLIERPSLKLRHRLEQYLFRSKEAIPQIQPLEGIK